MNNNFKNDKFVEVVQEFQIVQGQSVYQIGSIDLKDVYFFVKNGNENYKVLATGQYTVDGVNLTINDPNIILTNTHIQVCRVYSTVASKYISDVVNINTLREHYNVLVDDFINVIDFLRKSGIKSDSSAMNYVFPLLEEGQVFMRKGLGFEGRQIMDINGELQLQINKAVEIFEKYLNEQKKPEIDNYIGEKETELENRLEIFTQEKIQQINDVGLKLEINQTNHGFLFDAVQYDVSRGIYIKASAAYGADGMAIRINSNKFYLVSNGLVKVPDLAVDSGGRAYVMDEFYFLDNYIAGGCTPEKPTNIFQPLFCIVDKDGIKSALIQVDTPIDLEPREITELGLPNKENTIEDLIKSRKYKVGDVVQVLGYYSAGDGAGHQRIKKPVGYTGADAVIGADGSIWGLLNSSYVNVRWFGADNFNLKDTSPQIQKAIDYCRGELHFPTGVYKVSTKNFQESVFEVGHSIKLTGTTARYTEILIDNLGENTNIITLTNKSADNGIRFLSITDLNIRPIADYTNGHCIYYKGDTNLEWIAQAEIKRNNIGCFGKEGIYLENVKTSPEWVGYQTGGWCLSIIEDNFIHNGIKLIECGDSNIIRKNVITSASDNIGKNFIGINCKNIFGSSLLVIEDNNITTKGGSVAILEEGLRCKILRNNCELDQVKNINTNSMIMISGNPGNTGLSNITIEDNSLQDLSYVNNLASYCDDIISINNAKVTIKNNSILGTSNGIRISGGVVDQYENTFNNKLKNKINYIGGLITGYEYALENLSSTGMCSITLLDSFRTMNVYGDFTKNDTGAIFRGIPLQPSKPTTVPALIKRNGYNELCSILNNQLLVNNDSSREACLINYTIPTWYEVENER